MKLFKLKILVKIFFDQNRKKNLTNYFWIHFMWDKRDSKSLWALDVFVGNTNKWHWTKRIYISLAINRVKFKLHLMLLFSLILLSNLYVYLFENPSNVSRYSDIYIYIYIYAHYACQNLCSLRSTSSNKEFTFFFF